jgi:hypothetical protein
MRRRTPGVPPRMDRSSQPVAAASHGCGSGAASDREPPGLLLVTGGDSPPAPLTRARIRLQATARRSNQRESLRRPRPGRFDRGARMLSWTTTVPTEAPRAHGSMQHLRSGVLGAARAGCHQSPFAVPPSGCVAPRRAGTYLQPVRENGHRGSPCRCYGRAALYRSRIRCPAGVGSSRKTRGISSLRGSSFDSLGAGDRPAARCSAASAGSCAIPPSPGARSLFDRHTRDEVTEVSRSVLARGEPPAVARPKRPR